ALLVWMTWLWPSLLGLSRIVQPDTILRWHRAGFRAYWRWKSRGRPGRPRVSRELRELIQRMSKENPLWGAPRIHGELLKLGFEIAESTISKYMIRRRGPPSQSWRTFLRNHAHAIAAIDLCVVPTLTFERLFAFLVVGHGRRQLLWFAVTRHPTAQWLVQQIVEAFPWGRLIGTLRRECLDHVLIYGERHLRRILTLYSLYYNETRTHLGLGKDTPLRRSVQRSGSPYQSCSDCIIVTRGYDFREGQVFPGAIHFAHHNFVSALMGRGLASTCPSSQEQFRAAPAPCRFRTDREAFGRPSASR